MTEPTAVDLGNDFDPTDVGCGYQHCCSVSSNASLKCWGWNDYGQLGYGDTEIRGDESEEMGDFLDVVQLPTDFIIEQLNVSMSSTCVVSTEKNIVCFGRNNKGQCGVGHSDNIGDDADQMGDNLVAVDLGEDFVVKQLDGGYNHRCAVSTVGAVKWFVVSFTIYCQCTVQIILH